MSDAEIMRLLEGALGEEDRARIRSHMRSCSLCYESCRDSAIVRGVWLADESAFSPAGELVAEAVKLVAQPVPERPDRETALRSTPGARARRYRRLGFAAAGAAAVLVVGLLWFPRNGPGPRNGALLDTATLSPVRSAIEVVSARGPFVLPGGERALDWESPAYRSGFVPLSDSLASSFERLELAFRNGDSSADLACWLIGGYIATGQKDAARDVAGHPRFEQATDWRFAVLKALVAYMHGDSGESERLLRGVVASDPDNPVALIDLAIVLSEEGRGDEARAILARVSEAHAGTPLATRAVTIASRIEGP